MSIHRLGITTLATLATLALASFTQAGFTREAVHGRLRPVTEGAKVRGTFHMHSRLNDAGAITERILIECGKLDTTKVGEVSPEYHLWLVNADATASADAGALNLGKHGHGRFRFNSDRDVYPVGVDLVSDFGGGTVEVRNGETAVLRGTIPAFDGEEAVGVSHDTSRLVPPENGRGHGWMEARHKDGPKGSSELMRIQITNLARSAGPYTAVAITGEEGATTETLLATMTVRGRYGACRASIDTKKGGVIPGGAGLAGLTGQAVEVRDKDANVVLTGLFPTITTISAE